MRDAGRGPGDLGRATLRAGALRCAATLLLGLAAAGCEVEWGGARVALEDPAPPPPEPEAEETVEEEATLPLPEGPFLYLLRRDGPTGALVTPVAALPPGGGTPIDLELPSPWPAEFRARFDSTYLRPGTELVLQRWGERIGSVVLESARPPRDRACPSVADGTLLLLPGQSLPEITVALPPGLSPAAPERAPSFEPLRGMTVAAPVIAERLIGGDRAYLARRVSLQAVRVPGDTAPAMAATYLIDDSLAVGPPGEEAVSLFFLSVQDPARGYATRWSELRRYGDAADKEAFEYLDWARTPNGMLHLLRLYGGSTLRLAAGFVPEGAEDPAREVEWREPPSCPTLPRLVGG